MLRNGPANQQSAPKVVHCSPWSSSLARPSLSVLMNPGGVNFGRSELMKRSPNGGGGMTAHLRTARGTRAAD